RLDLKEVGIPFGNQHKGCKILLTSRDRDVLLDGMKAEKTFAIDVLDNEETWNLFKKMAGDSVERAELRSIAIEVAKKCARLPLAIATVANALSNKPLYVWKDALLQLQKPCSRNLSRKFADAYLAIQLSYNHLENEELKQAFLLCTWSLDDLPTTVVLTMHQGSMVTSMDFHPSRHTLLLGMKVTFILRTRTNLKVVSFYDTMFLRAVGSANGEITLWELGMRQRLVTKPFKIWKVSTWGVTVGSIKFQVMTMFGDILLSVNRVTWSPDGSFVGVAFSKHLIHLYAYPGSNDLIQIIQIDAHVGGVNDLAFAHINKRLCVVTCGDDDLIKVWDPMTGQKLFNFEDGRSFLVEWYRNERIVKRIYEGFTKKSAGVVSFDIVQNQFLAAGEDSQIKFWNMDDSNLLTFIDAEGGLPSLPRVRFNKEGNLLAVTTADDGFKILANAVGLRSLRANEASSSSA
ncbi:WD40 repeat - like 10, partial [Theobroma cacao]